MTNMLNLADDMACDGSLDVIHGTMVVNDGWLDTRCSRVGRLWIKGSNLRSAEEVNEKYLRDVTKFRRTLTTL